MPSGYCWSPSQSLAGWKPQLSICCWQVQEEGRERGSRRALCKLWHDFNEQVHSLGRAQLGAQQQSRPRFLWGLVPFQQVEVMSATAHCLLAARASFSSLGEGEPMLAPWWQWQTPPRTRGLFIFENQTSPFVCAGSSRIAVLPQPQGSLWLTCSLENK